MNALKVFGEPLEGRKSSISPSSITINQKYSLTEKMTQKMWDNFQTKISSSMHSKLNLAQQIKAKQEILEQDPSLSPS